MAPDPIHQLDEPLLLSARRLVRTAGPGRRLRQRAERVFNCARAHGVQTRSYPAVDVREAMKPLPSKARWPAIIDLPRLRVLVRDVDRAEASPVTHLASRLLGLTAQRAGMAWRLPWAESVGVDWSRPKVRSAHAPWRVPSARMKFDVEERGDEQWNISFRSRPRRSRYCTWSTRSPAEVLRRSQATANHR